MPVIRLGTLSSFEASSRTDRALDHVLEDGVDAISVQSWPVFEDAVGNPERDGTVVRVADLPPVREPRSLEDAARCLEERMAAHPLAGRLEATARVAEAALAWAPAVDVAAMAARLLVPAAFARALALALASDGGAFRGPASSDLRGLAAAALDGGLFRRVGLTERECWSTLPRVLDSSEQQLAFDREVRSRLVAAAGEIAHRIALPRSEALALHVPALPLRVQSLAEGLERVEAAAGQWERRRALADLAGQPLEGVRQLVTGLLGTRSSSVAASPDDLELWESAVAIVASSERDLEPQIRAREREEAAVRAELEERAALSRAAAEAERKSVRGRFRRVLYWVLDRALGHR